MIICQLKQPGLSPVPMSYDEVREKYRPAQICCLFIGEFHTAGGNLFYNENLNLYYATKAAFEQAAKRELYAQTIGTSFNSEVLRSLGCRLYDVCAVPANNPASQK